MLLCISVPRVKNRQQLTEKIGMARKLNSYSYGNVRYLFSDKFLKLRIRSNEMIMPNKYL